MIDKEAKIFGKINIIDLVLVVGLVGLIAFGAYQFYSGRGIIGGETREFIATFFHRGNRGLGRGQHTGGGLCIRPYTGQLRGCGDGF
ncbi:MAG: DUF4330 domain-containing protein [Defluviitaleaceae bacterium]|nr:DUF4330 domain-containing protein [Defluviitaleaceae bacterium]